MAKKLNKKENSEFWKSVNSANVKDVLNLKNWFDKSTWPAFLKKFYNFDSIKSIELHHDHEYNDNWYEYKVTSFILIDIDGYTIPQPDFDCDVYDIDGVNTGDLLQDEFYDTMYDCYKNTPLYTENAGYEYQPKKTNLKIELK